jgi:DNA-binding winged helix-turn-helix (wHTH) protein
MSEPQKLAYLLIRSSTDPDTTSRVDLTADVTCLGRPEPQDTGPNYIDLQLENVSRKHARIVRQDNEHVLENWLGKGKIGVYERSLAPGETHTLRHCDIFRIPDIEGPHLRIMFIEESIRTRFLPLEVEQQRPHVRIFGEDLKVAPLEHKLLSYLYQHFGELCRWDDVIVHLWPGTTEREDMTARKEQLEVLLTGMRNKIRPLSGGFTFMESFRGEGIRLVI